MYMFLYVIWLLYSNILSPGHHEQLTHTAERIKAVDRAAFMIEDILKQGQNSLPGTTALHSTVSNGQATQPLSACLYLGFETDPSLNIAARIRGPNDNYINHIMNETGATVVLRGRGSGIEEDFGTEEEQQPLHLYLSSTNPKRLEAARNLAENLLDTISAECGASRISSCYTPSPAPNGSTGSDVCLPGTSIHSGGLSNYGNPSLQVVSYTYPSVSGGTYYSGYGGIYPQATPLQQVALALRKAPAQTTPGLASTACATISSTASAEIVSSNMTSSSSAETEKRRQQRRKFQEVVSNETAASCQNFLQASECLKPGLKDSNSRNISSMPPPKKLIHKDSDGMPPPPPQIMPPPPPKFDALRSPSPSPPPKFAPHRSASPIEKCQEPGTKKPNDGPVSATLLKLVDYGEDDDDDDIDVLSVESFRSNVVQKTSSKPFWAV
ncbi:uncharacterized protein A4U43_C08F15320 [Asparagus officinalis]|nr:uncharacterized protein A4U43_C08F15320 [Asparagus officinalis]